jgi:aromatic amino acid transport protein AroP
MAITPGMAISVWLIPVWLVILGIGYWIKNQQSGKSVNA